MKLPLIYSLFLLIAAYTIGGCGTIQKIRDEKNFSLKDKEKETTKAEGKQSADSSHASEEKKESASDVNILFGKTDTSKGCPANSIVIDPNTGLIQASGSIASASIKGTNKSEKKATTETHSASDYKYVHDRQKDVIRIYSEKIKTIVKDSWRRFFIGLGLGLLLMCGWNNRKAIYVWLLKRLNPVKPFWPF